MEHEIPAIDVLHDEEEMVPGQEWRLLLHGQHLALVEGALNVVLLDDQVLLQALDGEHIAGGLVLCKEHLSCVCVCVCVCVCCVIKTIGEDPLPDLVVVRNYKKSLVS